MEKPQALYELSVSVQIRNTLFNNGVVEVRENVPIKSLDFKEMAEILEAFHVLVEKYRFK